MEGIQTLKGSWPWPWPSIWPYGISSCSSHRPLPIYQISFKLKKLFCGRTDVRTYGRTYGRTDIFPLYTIRSTFGSRPKNVKKLLRVAGWVGLCTQWVSNLLKVACSVPGVSWTRNLSVTTPILYHYTTAPTHLYNGRASGWVHVGTLMDSWTHLHRQHAGLEWLGTDNLTSAEHSIAEHSLQHGHKNNE